MSDNASYAGPLALGIELGSTRVKAVLIDGTHQTIASGSHEWRSHMVNGHWSYSLEAVWAAVQGAVAQTRSEFENQFGVPLQGVDAMGVSAMMHGYLAFDSAGNLLTPFRTWQDTTTAVASRTLTDALEINIPLRWSVAHLYQAALNQEVHVGDVAMLTTLAGYVHWRLTGERVLGICDASGMFPVDPETLDYDARRLRHFDDLAAKVGIARSLKELLPTVLTAGQEAGFLTPAGAELLVPEGGFRPGARFAPPEGDAGTGMVATNTIRPKMANVSVGTSVFAMVVACHMLSDVHEELDQVTTPDGLPVVMVHCNNGAADLQDWIRMFGTAARLLGAEFDSDTLFRLLYEHSLEGSEDAAGLVSFSFRAGEPIAGIDRGRPLFVRTPDVELGLADFMRANLYSVFAVLRLGFDVLREEGVDVSELFAHGGIFKTEGVAQRYLAAALDVPVTVSGTASDGGAWGMALLAAFGLETHRPLAEWLDQVVFTNDDRMTVQATDSEIKGFGAYMERFRAALPVERIAAQSILR